MLKENFKHEISKWIHNDSTKNKENVLTVQKESPKVFSKTAIQKSFGKLTRNHLCWGLFFNKPAGFGVST